MFAELLEAMQQMEDRIMARFDQVDKILAEHTVKLDEILAAVTLPPAVSGVLVVTFEGITKEGVNVQMKVPMNSTGTATVAYKNATGGKGRTDGPPTWSAEPAEFVTLTPSADGLSCGIVTAAVPEDTPVQSVIITVDADGDLGEGKTDIVNTGILDIYDPAQGAAIGEVTFGEFVPNV